MDHFDYIIPVPIHWSKKIRRGFNQSEVIAQEISNQLGIPLNTNALKRRRGKSQTKKNRLQRFEGLKGAFYLENNSTIMNKNCLLVDDVFTTGATSIQCLTLLQKAGARNTGFLCLAYNSVY
jgi:ComF family protein